MKRAPIEFDKLSHDIWLIEGKLNARSLSKAMEDGKQSAKIWSSFQEHLIQSERDTLLKEKNPHLRLYSELYSLLESPVSADKQRKLAKLVQKHSVFVVNQLQHDSELRIKFLLSLRDCSHIASEYRILLEQITKTPALAKDFETLLLGYMTNTPCNPPLHIPYHNKGLRSFLVNSYETYPTISLMLLRNPENFKIEFIARTVLSRNTLPSEFKAELKSLRWQFRNLLKLIIASVSTTLGDLMFNTPPITSKLLDTIVTHPEINKPAPARVPVNFNQFKTISADQLEKVEGVLTKRRPSSEDFLIEEDSGISPIKSGLPARHLFEAFYTPDSHVREQKHLSTDDEPVTYQPTYFTS
ncbi:MAG: hypothetical protein K2X50_06535 [Gammaproteobacteria bacterium]|nr:hypothetical protein [Gammaproteobacteria bacterium]